MLAIARKYTFNPNMQIVALAWTGGFDQTRISYIMI